MSDKQWFSLTPGFSRVAKVSKRASRFSGLPAGKTVETVLVILAGYHRAKARC
jgi:hypothetical protein